VKRGESARRRNGDLVIYKNAQMRARVTRIDKKKQIVLMIEAFGRAGKLKICRKAITRL
jgi:hypothetical protein